MDIENIRQRVLSGRYVISFTHTEKLRRRKINLETIEEVIQRGEIIEDYPNDPRGHKREDRFMWYAERLKMISSW